MARRRPHRTWSDRIHLQVAALQARFARGRLRPHGEFFDYPPHQTAAEERVNAWTHAIAALASFMGMVWLVVTASRHAGLLMGFGCLLYGGSLTAVFAMSALSHFARPPRLRHLFRTLDQASIYLLTAGSFTPYFLRYLVPQGWDWMLPVLWGAALLLAWDKVRGERVNSVSIPSHVALALFPFLATRPMVSVMPAGCLWLVTTAILCYLVGLLFLVWDHRGRYLHAVWHILVMIASGCTFAGVALYLV